MNKDKLKQILQQRCNDSFSDGCHNYELGRLRSAIISIEELVPPSYFEKLNAQPLPTAEEWIDAEKCKPKHGDKIIVIDAVGLFWGVYYSNDGGEVFIENNHKDSVSWDNIHEWIPYPKW